MLNRSNRRPLSVEQLESRVYLSVSSRREVASLIADRNSIAADNTASANDLVSVLRLGTTAGRPLLLVLDVNGTENPGDALLTTFDRNTGQLIGSIPIAAGQLIFVADAQADFTGTHSDAGVVITGDVSPLDHFQPVTLDRTVTDMQNANFSPGNTVTENNLDEPPVPEPHPNPPPRRPPIVVVIPKLNIPEPTGQEPVVSEPAPADRHTDSGPPPIVITEFGRWITLVAPSPWWVRTTELSAVQLRIGELLNPQSGGISDQPGVLADAASGALSFAGSRLFLHTPVRSVVFTTPRTAPEPGDSGLELALYNFETGQLNRTGHAVFGRLARVGNQIAFLGSSWDLESDAGATSLQSDRVVQLFNPITLGIRDTGISAEAIRVEGGQIVLGIRTTAAIHSGDGADRGTLMAHRFDPASGRLVNLHAPYVVTPEVPVSARETGRRPAGTHDSFIQAVLGSPSGPPKPGGSSGDDNGTDSIAAPGADQGGDGSGSSGSATAGGE